MSAPRLVLWLFLGLLLAAPMPLSAQERAPNGPNIVQTPKGLAVELACPTLAAPVISADGGPPGAAIATAAPAPPLALALVVETSPVMAAPGTPYSTRLADIVLLATVLLDRLAPGSSVSLITFDSGARVVLPRSASPLAAREALLGLQPATPELSAAPPLAGAAALALAAEELRGAPPGPRAAVIFAASTPEPAIDITSLRIASGPDSRVLLVGLGPDLTGPADNFTPFVPFHTADSTALPALMAEYIAQASTLAGTPITGQGLAQDALGSGQGQVAVTGCPAPASFVARVGLHTHSIAATLAALAVAGAGYLLWRRRAPRGEDAASRVGTARYRGTASATTARQGGGQDVRVLSIAVWDGQQRRIYTLTRRQHTVGRDSGCDISIESEWVSGLHARISVVADCVEITDLGSTNGTFLSGRGQPLVTGVPAALHGGDVVLIGPDVQLTLQPADASPGEESDL